MTAYTATIVFLVIVISWLVAAVLRQRYVYASRVTRLTLRLTREQDSYARLISRYMAVCKRDRDRCQRAAQAPQPAEEPDPYLPAFTTGALPEDLDEAFDDLMRQAFIADEEATR